MATNSNWTVVFEDKIIIKQNGDGAGSYTIDDDTFWGQSKFSNIWAIHYGTSNTSDEVEYRDKTPHSTFADANIGDINQFTNKWDSTHLSKLQSDWDDDNVEGESEADNVEGESEADKIARLGERPISYSS
jgi:hypothetical protein